MQLIIAALLICIFFLITMPPRSNGQDFRRIYYEDLVRMQLLSPQERPDPSLLERRSKRWKIAEGLVLDLEGDGKDEVIVAGMLEEPSFVDSGKSNCFIKIMKKDERANFQTIARHDIKSGWNWYDKMEGHILSKQGHKGVHVTFDVYGSNYGATMTVFVSCCEGKVVFFEEQNDEGSVEFQDLNNDGKEEILVSLLVNAFPVPGLRIMWTDIKEWNCNGLILVDSQYPEFYKKEVRRYQENIDNAPINELGTKPWVDKYIEANRSMIAKAQRYIPYIR